MNLSLHRIVTRGLLHTTCSTKCWQLSLTPSCGWLVPAWSRKKFRMVGPLRGTAHGAQGKWLPFMHMQHPCESHTVEMRTFNQSSRAVSTFTLHATQACEHTCIDELWHLMQHQQDPGCLGMLQDGPHLRLEGGIANMPQPDCVAGLH